MAEIFWRNTSVKFIILVLLFWIISVASADNVTNAANSSRRKPLTVIHFDGSGIFKVLDANLTLTISFDAFATVYVRNTYSDYGLMEIEAMRYAVKIVNEHMYLLGFELKLEKLNDGFDDMTAFKMGDIMIDSLIYGESAVAVGPASSLSIYYASYFSHYSYLSLVSPGATFSDLEDGVSSNYHTVRTVPSDTYRLQALIDIIQQLKWKYFAIISSTSYNGYEDSRKFRSKLAELDICVATNIGLDENVDKQAIKKNLKRLSEDKKVKAIIFFTTARDSRNLMEMLRSLNLERRYYFIFFYGTTLDRMVTKGFEASFTGALSIDIAHEENLAFKEYFLNLSAVNMSMIETILWQHIFECNAGYLDISQKNCTLTEKLSEGIGYYPEYHVNQIIDAVYGAAYLLRRVIETLCFKYDTLHDGKKYCTHISLSLFTKNNFQPTLFQEFSNVTYSDTMLQPVVPWDKKKIKQPIRYNIYNFIVRGSSFENVAVGYWEINRTEKKITPNEHLKKTKRQFVLNETQIWWRTDIVGRSPNISCSEKCEPGYKAVTEIGFLCCWICVLCPKNHITVNNTCTKCSNQQTADLKKNKCVLLPQVHIESAIFVTFIVLTCLGLCSVLFVFIVVLLYKEDHIFRASGNMIWFIILQGILVLFLVPIPNLFTPTKLLCLLRVVLPGLSCVLIYSSLGLKLYRIHRTFFGVKTSLNRQMLVSAGAQSGILFVLVFFNGSLVASFLAAKLPSPETKIIESSYFTVQCTADKLPKVFMSLVMGLISMVFCTIVAFKVRHFPHNHHETRSIAITMYVSVIIWFTFLLVYYYKSGLGRFNEEYAMSGVSLIIGFVTLIGLYGKKVLILLKTKVPVDRSSPDGSESRSRGWSHVSKTTSNRGLSDVDSPRDLQSFLDHHCPLREVIDASSLDETVFAGDRHDSFSMQ